MHRRTRSNVTTSSFDAYKQSFSVCLSQQEKTLREEKAKFELERDLQKQQHEQMQQELNQMKERDKQRSENQRMVVDALNKRIQDQSEDLINKYRLCLEMESELKKQKEIERKVLETEVLEQNLKLNQSEKKAIKL